MISNSDYSESDDGMEVNIDNGDPAPEEIIAKLREARKSLKQERKKSSRFLTRIKNKSELLSKIKDSSRKYKERKEKQIKELKAELQDARAEIARLKEELKKESPST